MAQVEKIVISPPKITRVLFKIIGTSPLVQARFSQKAAAKMRADMEAGSQSKSRKKREPRDFDSDFKGAMHIAREGGWNGHPASAFRNACIDVCRMVGFKMTHAKMSVFVASEGSDVVDGQPLVKILGDKPEKLELAVRLPTGQPDIRVRPMWREWSINLGMDFDSDQFSKTDIANLVQRAGMQVGIGEGRPYSKSSAGMGYGTFKIAEELT